MDAAAGGDTKSAGRNAGAEGVAGVGATGQHAKMKKGFDYYGWLERHQAHIAAFAAYMAIALVMFHQITVNMNSVIPGTGGDSYQNLWNLWWVNYAAFSLHANVYTTRLLFWPIGANLAYQTMAPLTALMALPLLPFGLMFAYNAMFILGFALSGLAMFILADYLVRDKGAALVSGMIYTFSAVHIAQSYAHMHFMHIEWIPLFLYFAVKVVRDGQRRWDVAGMAATFALATLMGVVQQSVMLAMLLALVVLAYSLNRGTRKLVANGRFVRAMGEFLVLSFVLGSWSFVPIARAAFLSGNGVSLANYLNDAQHNMLWSDNLLGFFVPSNYNGILSAVGLTPSASGSIYLSSPSERTAYIGYTALALAAYGVYRRRKETVLWAVMGMVFAWLALGPYLQVGSSLTGIPGLYTIYHSVPYLNIVREPGRFDIMAMMFIAVLAAYGASEALRAVRERSATKDKCTHAYAALAAIIALVFIEANGMPLGHAMAAQTYTAVQVPHIYSLLRNLTGNFSVLALPIVPIPNSSTPELYAGQSTYYTSVTRRPIIGGYVGRENTSQALSVYNIPLALQAAGVASGGNLNYSSPVAQNYMNQTLLSLYNYGTAFVIVNKGAYSNYSLLTLLGYLYKTFGTPIYNDNTTVAFQTSRAINASVYRSFVAFPILTQWAQATAFINGAYKPVWSPQYSGAVAVYAPYSNDSVRAGLLSAGRFGYVNATIRINAMAGSGQSGKLYVMVPVSANSTHVVAVVNVTSKMSEYSVNMTMASGPIGNTVFFVAQQGQAVYISNMSFSKEGSG